MSFAYISKNKESSYNLIGVPLSLMTSILQSLTYREKVSEDIISFCKTPILSTKTSDNLSSKKNTNDLL